MINFVELFIKLIPALIPDWDPIGRGLGFSHGL
jgi:hypothetical protein